MNKKPLGLIGIFLCVLCGCLPRLQGGVRTVEPKDFIGTWIGYGADGLSFHRLALDPDGKGFLTVSGLPNYPTHAYRVVWRLNPGLSIAVKPLETASEPVTLRQLPSGAAMTQLTFVIRIKDWERKLQLYNEADFQARSASTAERMKKVREEGK